MYLMFSYFPDLNITLCQQWSMTLSYLSHNLTICPVPTLCAKLQPFFFLLENEVLHLHQKVSALSKGVHNTWQSVLDKLKVALQRISLKQNVQL